MKEAVEGFIYLSKRSNAPLIISDLKFSHKFWNERYFFVSGRSWEYDPIDKEGTLGVPAVWTTLENLRELFFVLVWSSFHKLQSIPNFALAVRSSGIRPDLSPKDRVVKQKLAKCLPRAYSKLIKSGILGSLGSKSSRPATLRPSPPSVKKFSHDGPPVVKPTKGELQAQVETLSRRSRSVKRKPLDSLERGHPAWGKAPKRGHLPISECRGKYCHLRPRFRGHQVRGLVLFLLQRPKIPRRGLLSLRWRLCTSQFRVLLRRALSLLLR